MSERGDGPAGVRTRRRADPGRLAPAPPGPGVPGRGPEGTAPPGRVRTGRGAQPEQARPGELKSRSGARPGVRQPPGGGARARPGTRPRLPGAGPARSAPRPRRSGPAAPSGQSRTPFIFLLVGLLGGGLICLLVINTVLAAGSYQITNLQKINETQLEQVQTLRQQVASNRSPGTIAREARNLGMIQPPLIKFLDLRTGRIISQPATEQGFPIVGGYAP